MSQVQALEEQAEDFKAAIEKREMAIRLYNNPDFKKLILEEFMVHECARYAQNSQNPALDAGSQIDCLNIAQSAGHLKRWLRVVEQMAEHADKNMTELQENLDAARAEELEAVEGPE